MYQVFFYDPILFFSYYKIIFLDGTKDTKRGKFQVTGCLNNYAITGCLLSAHILTA